MDKFSKIERYDGARFIIHFAPKTVQVGDETREEYSRNILVAKADKGSIVEAIIRERYSISDELSLLRQRTAKKAEFNEYNDFAEGAKAIADAILEAIAE